MKTVLVLDDAPVTLTMIKNQLKQHGYNVLTGTDGLEGLVMIQNNQVDLVITDIEMPMMDGIDFYNRIHKVYDHIPVIIITDSVTIRENFRILGVNDFISKPIDGEDMIKKVNAIFKMATHKTLYGKVLVVNSEPLKGKEIKTALESCGFAVELTSSGMDSISLALKFVPRLILIDILMKDIPAREIIKALGCFVKLHPLKIVVFTTFDPSNIGRTYTLAQIEEAKNVCIDAGADIYIGRFSKERFLGIFDNLFNPHTTESETSFGKG
jgi:CheY-like chemotaxis protein